MNNIKYLKYLIKHKFYVTRECFRVGLYWRGLVHDLSKFNPMEWNAYRNYFYGEYTRPYADFNAGMKCEFDCWAVSKEGVQEAFDFAWLHHQHKNKHHWQYHCKYIIGNFINKNDEIKNNGEYKCNHLKQNIAVSVDSKSLEKNFYMVGKLGNYVENIIKYFITKNIDVISKLEKLQVVYITEKMQKCYEKKQKTVWQNVKNWCLTTIVMVTLNVHVVVNLILNFLLLTILKVVGTNIGKNIQEDLVGCIHMRGQSKTITHQFLDSYATTVIPHMDILGTVHMRETNILIEDSGVIKCLKCGEVISPDCIVPLDMPYDYVVEMVCDWIGAGMAITGKREADKWYAANKDKMQLSPLTRERAEILLDALI